MAGKLVSQVMLANRHVYWWQWKPGFLLLEKIYKHGKGEAKKNLDVLNLTWRKYELMCFDTYAQRDLEILSKMSSESVQKQWYPGTNKHK